MNYNRSRKLPWVVKERTYTLVKVLLVVLVIEIPYSGILFLILDWIIQSEERPRQKALTQEEYDKLEEKDTNMVYVIVKDENK